MSAPNNHLPQPAQDPAPDPARNPVRKLLLFSLANILIALVLFAHRPTYSELILLRFDLSGRIVTDSSRFMQQAWDTLGTGKPLYPTLFFQQHIKFIYPTSSLLTNSVATLLHIPLDAFVKWLVLLSVPLTLLIAGDCFLLAYRASSPRGAPVAHSWVVRLLIALLGFFFYPLVLSVSLGQIQTFLTFFFTLAFWFWLRDRKSAAGICLALICTFKPPLALFLLWAILRRQWSFFWSFAVSALLIQIVAILLFGWRNELDYLSVLGYLSHHGEVIVENQSVNGMLERWFQNGRVGFWSDTSAYPPYNPFIYAGTMLTSALFLIFGLVVPVLRKRQATPADFLVFAMVSTIASPIVWIHHYGFFYIASIYFLAVSLRCKDRIPLSFAAAFIVLANFWPILGRLQGRVWVPLFTYDLFAGLAIILLIAFAVDHPEPSASQM